MSITASVSGKENHEAIVALFLAGFFILILALVFLGHSSFELTLQTGSVTLTKRWFLVSGAVCGVVANPFVVRCALRLYLCLSMCVRVRTEMCA
jgi:hypothetical protein